MVKFSRDPDGYTITNKKHEIIAFVFTPESFLDSDESWRSTLRYIAKCSGITVYAHKDAHGELYVFVCKDNAENKESVKQYLERI